MTWHMRSCGWLAVLFTATCLGCGSADSPAGSAAEAEPSADQAQNQVEEAMGEHEHGSDEDIAVTLAKLPEGEREAAIGQKVCPVSGEPLGSMGVPVKVTVESRDVFICCEGCRDMLEKEPAKYLANLDAKKE